MRRPKRIIRDGIEMFYCLDCDEYLIREEMSERECRKYGVGIYCRKHDHMRKEERKKKRKERKKEKYKLDHRVSNEKKYYFKGREQQICHGPDIKTRASGISKLWGRKLYERRSSLNEWKSLLL